jgi:hypothetical protein
VSTRAEADMYAAVTVSFIFALGLQAAVSIVFVLFSDQNLMRQR